MAKSNREYWQERQIEAVLRSDENAKRIHQEMKQIYQDTADRINDEIAKFYGKFSKKNKIPLHELTKLLSAQELGKWKMSLEKYLEQIHQFREADEKQAEALLLELNLLSGSTRVNRLEALQAQISAQMAYLAQIEDNKVRDHLVEEYQGNYYRAMYALYQTGHPRVLTLMEQSRVRVDPIQVYDTLKLPWSGANYSQRIWKRQYDVATKVKNMVTRQLMVGTSMKSLTKEITAELGKDYKHAAERLVRTETAYAHTMADLEVYRRLGIEEYEFIATLDYKTSEICQSLDLKRFKVSEAQVGKNYPPMHPHCRSTTGIYDPEWDEETRIARGTDGKNYSVPANMNYEEWYSSIDSKEQDKMQLLRTMDKNKSADLKQFKKFKNILGKDIPKTFEEFQAYKYTKDESFGRIKTDYRRRNYLLQHPESELPNVDTAAIAEEKFTKYLFGGNIKKGLEKGKNITKKLGYDISNYQEFQEEILRRAKINPAKHKGDNAFGARYEQKVMMYNEDNEPINLIVAWQVNGESTHMTTIYIKEV